MKTRRKTSAGSRAHPPTQGLPRRPSSNRRMRKQLIFRARGFLVFGSFVIGLVT